MEEKIHFFVTNDLHSHFEHWPHVMTHLNRRKQEWDRREESYFLFDIGDHLDRVNPITEATMGKANIELLNQAGYDFATLGNNEGITLPKDDLYHLYDDATFNVICSNLHHQTVENPNWLQTNRVIETKQGTRVGVIGLTARFNPYYHLLDWDAAPVEETIEQELMELDGKTDLIILMSHLGINEDERIARTFPQIDVIMGGHTHHLLRQGEEVHQSLLTAAGKFCSYISEVSVLYDHDEASVTRKQAAAIDITHLPADPDTLESIQQLDKQADKILQDEIYYANEPLPVDWFHSTVIMEALTEKVRQKTNADCAMLNAGLLIHGFSEGMITYKDVHQACPHPINPVVVSLNGDELLEVIRSSLSDAFMELELKGFGFRGKLLGRMVFANLDVQLGILSDGHQYVKEVLFQGDRIHRHQTYTVATADMFTFGRLLPPIARAEYKHLFLPEFMREILADTLLDMKVNAH